MGGKSGNPLLRWKQHESIAKRFKEGRVSVRDDERCGRSKEEIH